MTKEPSNPMLSFDPLLSDAPTPKAVAPANLGMPPEIAAAFAAAAAGTVPSAPSNQPQEFQASGLTKQGESDLMAMINESAKKMKKPDDGSKEGESKDETAKESE